MKNLFLGALALSLVVSVSSCKDAVKGAENAVENAGSAVENAGNAVGKAGNAVGGVAGDAVAAVGEKAGETVEKIEEVATGVPSFDNPVAKEYVNTYEAYFEECKSALQNKDMKAFTALGTKGSELAAKAQEVAKKLSPENAKKLTEYIGSKSEKLQELTKLFKAK